MAHVQMKVPDSEGFLKAALGNYHNRKQLERELATREKLKSQELGVQLQNTRANLDTQLEIAKINARNQRDIAKFKSGMDLQLKQMGIDLDLTLQKLRNMNAMEVAEFNARAARILETMRDTHKQNEILKEYQAQLRLHKYDAKTALYQTYLKTMGSVYVTGDPLTNAADAAAFSLWAMVFKMAFGNEAIDSSDAEAGDLEKKVELSSSDKEVVDEEINELIKVLKGEKQPEHNPHVAKGSKITRYPEERIKTKIQRIENQRSGSSIYKR